MQYVTVQDFLAFKRQYVNLTSELDSDESGIYARWYKLNGELICWAKMPFDTATDCNEYCIYPE